MILWTKEMKGLWGMLVLGGATIEKRHERHIGCGRYAEARWYVTLPRPSYLSGPFKSKTAAVLYAAEAMEIDQCLIPQQRTSKSSRSASRSAA